MKTWTLGITIAAAALSSTIAFSAAANSQQSKIFVSNQDGQHVPGDCFTDCCDVYLNAKLKTHHNNDCDDDDDECGDNDGCWHPYRLRDGEYYFQVTDVCGAHLLSTDDIEQRRIRIEDGVIVQYLGASGQCNHEIGDSTVDNCNPPAISVQLMPFDETPRHDKIYKAWITPVCDYDPTDCHSVFGFRHNRSKTDNFKCHHQTPEIPDPPIPPAAIPLCTLVINEYFDANASGSNDVEQPLDGIRFNVSYQAPGGAPMAVILESGQQALGQTSIDLPAGSIVVVSEILPGTGLATSQWMQTEPNQDSIDATLVNGQWGYSFAAPENANSVYTLSFGSVSLYDPSGGKTVKFWRSNAGRRILENHDSAWRGKIENYPVRCANGKAFAVPAGDFDGAYAAFKAWMGGAGSNNMACQLSNQLAATRLTGLYVHLNINSRVLIAEEPADALLMNGNVATIRWLIKQTCRALGPNGMTIAPSPARTRQETLNKVLRQINANHLMFVNGQPAAIVY